MYIKELKISNYRSVPEEPIRFTPKMNFVIGENNTGKTSLLDCLERLFSKSTMPAGDFKDENNPITAYATIRFEESEIGLCGDYADSAMCFCTLETVPAAQLAAAAISRYV